MVGVNSLIEQEAGSSSKQLLIKLKIPKLEGVVTEDDDELEEGEIREEPDHDIGTSKDLNTSSLNPIQNKDVSLNPIQNKDNIRVCPECFKEFSSGKALGGHMRIHAQQHQQNAHKKNHTNKVKPVQAVRFKKTQFNKAEKSDQQQQPYYLSKCIDENGRPVCKHCGKNFPSIKSLFGHMRCHPEREWRGILPPDHDRSSTLVVPNRKTSSSSSLSSTDDDDDDMPLASSRDDSVDSADVDSVMDLPKWSVRAKRGRRVEISPGVSVSSEEEVQLRDAVEDLMMLAKGDQSINESGLTHKQQRVDEFEATNSNSLTIKDDSRLKKRKFEEHGEGKAVIQMSEHDANYKNLSDNELSDSNDQLLTVNSNSVSVSTTPNKMMRKRKKMKLMMDLEPGLTTPPPPRAQPAAVVGATTTPDKYKCSTCNKTFPTHQALGGHRSSHNKFKITIFNAVVDKEDHDEDHGSNDDNVNLDENAKESAVASGSTSTHQCTICNKVFPTGQALGGHKRCHWTAPAADHQAGPPSSQVTSYSPGETSHTAAAEGPRRVLDFDLNEEPPMEEDEGGGDNASSSYNSNHG